MIQNRCFGCMEPIQSYPCPNCGFDSGKSQNAEYTLPVGTILAGKYLVGRVLGQGGFGITYIGWDMALERKVAIKEFYPSGQVSRAPGDTSLTWYSTEAAQQAQQNGMGMFLKEARKMSKVDNIPGVVRVQDLFQENATAYIIMDFVEGVTLKARLQKAGPLAWDQAKGIFLPAIRTMEQVHQAGLIHRDLSPDNLMLTPEGGVRVLDLGAAKDLSINSGLSSMQVAKSGFSPWEQYLQQGGSGPWTDVYAMAATIYYTLTGKLPPNAVDRANQDTISWVEPGLAAMSAGALKALQKAMAVQARDRIQSMEILEKGLFEEKEAPVAPKVEKAAPKKVSQKRPGKSRPRWLIPTAAALVLCLGATVLLPRKTQKSTTQGNSAPKSSPSQPSVAASSTKFDDDTTYIAQLSTWTEHISTLENVGTMRSYLDSQGQERCRIYEDLDGKRQYVFTAEYDENGKVAMERCYDGDGPRQRVNNFSLASNGQLVSYETLDGAGTCILRTERTLDANNRCISWVQTDSNGKTRLTASNDYASDGSYTTTVKKANGNIDYTAQFNAEGQEASFSYYTPDGKLEVYSDYTYDANGNRSQQLQYSAAGNLEYETRFTYDGNKLIQEIHFSHGKQDSTTDYTYGSYGELLNSHVKDNYSEYQETRFRSIRGTLIREYTIYPTPSEYDRNSISQYDWDGNIISRDSYQQDGSLASSTDYTYDEFGGSTGSTSTTYLDNGSYSVREYDAEYNPLSSVTYNSNGAKDHWTEYIYSENTRRDNDYNSDGILTSYTEHQYNDQQMELWNKSYDAEGNLTSEYVYTYDTNGAQEKITATYYYSWNGGKSVTEYDGDWNQLSRKEYDANGNLTSSE